MMEDELIEIKDEKKNTEANEKQRLETAKNKKRRNFLCISAKTNSIQKYGKPKDKEEHMRRVLTRENTPCAHYNLQPVFTSKKEINVKELKAYFVRELLYFYCKLKCVKRPIIDRFFRGIWPIYLKGLRL